MSFKNYVFMCVNQFGEEIGKKVVPGIIPILSNYKTIEFVVI